MFDPLDLTPDDENDWLWRYADADGKTTLGQRTDGSVFIQSPVAQ